MLNGNESEIYGDDDPLTTNDDNGKEVPLFEYGEVQITISRRTTKQQGPAE